MIKELNLEAIARRTRAEAVKLASQEITEEPEEFVNWSLKELDTYRSVMSAFYVREAEIYAERIKNKLAYIKHMKRYHEDRFETMFDQMKDRVIFIMKAEKYTTETQGELCALMDVSARHYRDVRLKYQEEFDEIISDDIMDKTCDKNYAFMDVECKSFKRVMRELALIGLSGVSEWSNNEATEAQERMILNALEGAKVLSDTKLWHDTSVFEWYVSMNQDERVSAGCKV